MAFLSPPRLLSEGDSSSSSPLSGDRVPLSVYVLATSTRGTRAALQAAGSLGRDLDARIVLLVPHVVPYAQALEHPADSLNFIADRFRTLAAELSLDVRVRVCLCRPQDAALEPLIPPDAVVLLGGRTRRWWPTREQHLAVELRRAGHRVLFVQTDV